MPAKMQAENLGFHSPRRVHGRRAYEQAWGSPLPAQRGPSRGPRLDSIPVDLDNVIDASSASVLPTRTGGPGMAGAMWGETQVSRVGSVVTNSAACDSTPAGTGLRRELASLAPAPPPGYPAQALGVGASRRGTWTGTHFAGFSPRRPEAGRPAGPACSGYRHRPWICSRISDSGH